MLDIEIYTDGACIGNPGPGGFGVVIVQDGQQEKISGGFCRTTNNRMELMAAVVGLQKTPEDSAITLYSDSRYLVDSINQGSARRWKASGWMRNKKQPALNPDLWEKILSLCARHNKVTFIWVRGHAGHHFNELCDQLSNQAARQKNLPPDSAYENASNSDLPLFAR